MTHTPGEWKALKPKKQKYKDCWWIYRNEVGYIAKVYGIAGHSPQDPKEIEANARLIAAAPELLEACKDLIGQVKQAQKGFIRYVDSPTMNFAIKQAEQAIAKAEGKEGI